MIYGPRKGQFTMIVIISLIVLIAFAGIYYLSKNINLSPIEADADTEFALQIRNYVSQCLEGVGREAVEMAGRQAGYAIFEANDLQLSDTDRSFIMNPPGSENYIPYWHHIEGDCSTDCRFTSSIPPLEGTDSVSSGISDYIENNIESCISDFSGIKDASINIESAPKTEVIIGEGRILFNLNWRLRARTTGQESVLESYQSEVDIDFLRAYSMALAVNQFLQDRNFVERGITEQSLTSLSGGASPLIPPMHGGIRFNRIGPWTKQGITDRLKAMISDELGKVSLEGSLNSQMVLPETAAEIQNMNLLLSEDELYWQDIDYADLEVGVHYLPWLSMDVGIQGNGVSAGFVNPQPHPTPNIFNLLPQITDVNYIYDVSYPIIVQIEQPSAFNGKGFLFQFAYESNFLNNEPADGINIYTAAQSFSSGSRLCDVEQRNSGSIEIDVRNSVTSEPIADASVIFHCGDESCLMGETGEDGKYSSSFPVCGGGIVEVTKTGHSQEKRDYSTFMDQQGSLSIPLVPEFPIFLSVEKVMMEKVIPPDRNYPEEAPDWYPSMRENLREFEHVILTFDHHEEDYTRSIIFEGAPSNISLMPGRYDITATLVRDLDILGPHIIDEDELCTDVIGIVPGCQNTVELPAITFDSVIVLGSIELGNVEITADDLSNENIMISILAITENDLEKHIDLDVLNKMLDIPADNPSAYEPRFS